MRHSHNCKIVVIADRLRTTGHGKSVGIRDVIVTDHFRTRMSTSLQRAKDFIAVVALSLYLMLLHPSFTVLYKNSLELIPVIIIIVSQAHATLHPIRSTSVTT